MTLMKISVSIVLFALFAIHTNAQNVQKKDKDVYRIMMSMPDSLLSKEMKQTRNEILYYFFSYTDIVDGKLVYKPDNKNKDYKKLPKLYIDHILKDIEDINNCKDSAIRQLIMSSYPAMKQNTLAMLLKANK